MTFKLEKVLRTFEYSDQKNIGDGNHVFDAVAMDPGGKATHFARRITSIEDPWAGTVIVKNGCDVVGSGEDPRPFFWQGSVCISATTYSPGSGFINKVYIVDQDRWFPIVLPRKLDAGKNWTPFVQDDTLYFVHEFSPFRVLRADLKRKSHGFLTARTVAKFDVRLPKSRDKYPWLRGGSNAVQIRDFIVGVGHTNEHRGNAPEDIWHRPFIFVYRPDKSVSYFEMNYRFVDDFRIVDPTSLYIADGKLFLVTSETARVWSVAPQQGRTCLYSIDLPDGPNEISLGFGGRRLYRWPSGQSSKVGRILGAWRRYKGA